ncbi:MAG: NAD(P)H-dependent oxidoreductase [Clostridia bacterium]|nr:NAD(P)H-dependent oxidoreductase [Clostridia bacterium]
MSEKILVVKGSCRKGSVTNHIWQDALNSVEDIEISVFDAFSEAFAFCNGCNFCEEMGRCIHRDLDGFFKDFENADVVLFSSPVYNGGFSAPVKALIDRFQAYYTSFYKNGKTQPIKKKRKGILLVAAGRGGVVATEDMQKNLKCAFTILNMELAGTVLCANTDTVPDLEKAKEDLKIILKRSLSDE